MDLWEVFVHSHCKSFVGFMHCIFSHAVACLSPTLIMFFHFLSFFPPFFFSKKKHPFYFKIIMVSQVVVRSPMERSPMCFTQLLPTATSCKTRVRCHSQMLTLIQSRHAMFLHHEDHPCCLVVFS